MYNRQVLVDYFNGKRRLKDPELKREFLLLKQQAAIDWKATYANKDTNVTLESIVKDYIDDAKLAAKKERASKKIKIAIFIIVAMVAGLVLGLIMSAKGY